MNTPSPDSDQNTCPKCGRPILEGSPRGLCPLCLISEVSKDDSPPVAVPAPELDELRRAFPTLDIVEPLGAGGMGRVYKVRQPHLDRFCALKLLPPGLAEDPAWVERFTREARALARLNHPGIVQVYDFGEASSVTEAGTEKKFPFLLMEFVDGVNLRQALRSGNLTAAEALTIVPPICAALQYAHNQGVLHRDIKPENILLDAEGRVKIADFGVAKLAGVADAPGATLTATGAQLGTAAYMAPEQIEHPQDVDHRADIFSLGVVFYELLTGELPLGRFPAPSEKAGTDPRLDTIVFRTLEKERERRFQSAGEVKSEVEHVTSSEPPPMPASSVPISAPASTTSSPIASRRTVALILSLVILPMLLIVVALIIPAAARSAGSGGKVMFGVLGVVLAFSALVVAGFTWLFRRLRRGGLSTGVAAAIVALGLIIIPPAGCVALVVPAYVSHRRVVIPGDSATSGQFQLHRRSTSLSDGTASAKWELTSRRPLWIVLQFRDSTCTLKPGAAAGGRYITEIDASTVRQIEPNVSWLHLTLSNAGAAVNAEARFDEPSGDWLNQLFATVADDRLYAPGEVTLMHIGESPVILRTFTEQPVLPDEARFSMKNLYFGAESNSQYMGLDYTVSSTGDAELYFKTDGLPEPTFGGHQAMVSGRAEDRIRHVWFFPRDLDQAAVASLKEQIESHYKNKTINVARGQLWQFFQVSLPDGTIGRVFMGARKRSVEPQ